VDFGDVAVFVGSANGAGRGDFFPFGDFVIKGVGAVSGLKRLAGFDEFAIFNNAAANASAKGKINGFSFVFVALVKSTKPAVIFVENWRIIPVMPE